MLSNKATGEILLHLKIHYFISRLHFKGLHQQDKQEALKVVSLCKNGRKQGRVPICFESWFLEFQTNYNAVFFILNCRKCNKNIDKFHS